MSHYNSHPRFAIYENRQLKRKEFLSDNSSDCEQFEQVNRDQEKVIEGTEFYDYGADYSTSSHKKPNLKFYDISSLYNPNQTSQNQELVNINAIKTKKPEPNTTIYSNWNTCFHSIDGYSQF